MTNSQYVLQGKLDKAVEERDAALVLLRSVLREQEVWWAVRDDEKAANTLLRSRGLLGGEK